MPVFQIKVLENFPGTNILHVNDEIEIFCLDIERIGPKGVPDYIAYGNIYSKDFRKIGWKNNDYLEIQLLDESVKENLLKELRLIEAEKANIIKSQRYEFAASMQMRLNQISKKLREIE